MASTDMNGVEISDSQAADIRDTDIVFDCPHCGCNLAIDYRGAGLQINCSQCNKSVLVPIPDGMQLTDLSSSSSSPRAATSRRRSFRSRTSRRSSSRCRKRSARCRRWSRKGWRSK